MNTYSTIPITFVRDKVKNFYDITDTKKDVTIDLLIVDAVNEIQSKLNTSGFTVTLEICDNKAPVPCNFKTLVQIVSDACDDNGDNYYYDNFRFDGHSIWTCGTNRFKIENGYIIFPSNIEATQVDMYYIGYVMDENGFILLRKAHEPYYYRYAAFWFGGHIRDARYKMFEKWPNVKIPLVHNEQVDDFNNDKIEIEAITRYIGNGGRVYRGTYNSATQIMIG